MKIDICEKCSGAIFLAGPEHVCDPNEVELTLAMNAEKKRLWDLDRFLDAALAYCDEQYGHTTEGDTDAKRVAMYAAWRTVRGQS